MHRSFCHFDFLNSFLVSSQILLLHNMLLMIQKLMSIRICCYTITGWQSFQKALIICWFAAEVQTESWVSTLHREHESRGAKVLRLLLHLHCDLLLKEHFTVQPVSYNTSEVYLSQLDLQTLYLVCLHRLMTAWADRLLHWRRIPARDSILMASVTSTVSHY